MQAYESSCQFFAINFFELKEPEFVNNTSNCFENRIIDRKPYFKVGYVFKFEKFLPQTKLHTKKLSILMPFNEFLVP